jgi:hypothetical protein
MAFLFSNNDYSQRNNDTVANQSRLWCAAPRPQHFRFGYCKLYLFINSIAFLENMTPDAGSKKSNLSALTVRQAGDQTRATSVARSGADLTTQPSNATS